MQEWIDRYARDLSQDPLTQQEMDDLLELAREVSRGTNERRLAPLTTFLAGLAAAGSTGTRASAISDAMAKAREHLPKSTA